MNHPFTKTTRELKLADQIITYRLYKNPNIDSKRKLVLLHGARCGGCAYLGCDRGVPDALG